MNVLVIPEVGSQLDPSIRVGQSVARWSGGQWGVLHTLGFGVSSLVRGRADAERARRVVQLIARPETPPAWQRVTRRPLKSAVRNELNAAEVDLIVTNAHRASDGRRGGSLSDLIEVFGGPTLAVRDMLGALPGRICIVTEPQDIESDVLQAAVSWMVALLGPNPDGQTGLPVEVSLVHVAATWLDWSVAQFRFAEQSERGLGDPHVVMKSACPMFSRHVPEMLAGMRPHLVVVFQERRSGKQAQRIGMLARKIVDRGTYPVLLLPPVPCS